MKPKIVYFKKECNRLKITVNKELMNQLSKEEMNFSVQLEIKHWAMVLRGIISLLYTTMSLKD